jgi:hypothetical protein
MGIKRTVIATYLGIPKDVQTVVPVSCSSSSRKINDRVGIIWPKLVNRHVEFIVKKELSGMHKFRGNECIVRKDGPLWMHLYMNVCMIRFSIYAVSFTAYPLVLLTCSSSCIIAGKDGSEACYSILIRWLSTTEESLPMDSLWIRT